MSDQFEFDAFLAHNSKDKPNVKIIAAKLKEKQSNLELWLDEEKIPGGQTIVSHLQKAITNSRCVVFFIGTEGQGKWQNKLEYPIFVEKYITEEAPLIPVLLPGVDDIPNDDKHSFIRGINYIKFSDIEDSNKLSELFSSIKEPAKAEYSKKVEECLADDGKISKAELAGLVHLQEELKLTDDEAGAILNKKSGGYKKKLDIYKKTFNSYLKKESDSLLSEKDKGDFNEFSFTSLFTKEYQYPLSEEEKKELQKLEKLLKINKDDVDKLEKEAKQLYFSSCLNKWFLPITSFFVSILKRKENPHQPAVEQPEIPDNQSLNDDISNYENSSDDDEDDDHDRLIFD